MWCRWAQPRQNLDRLRECLDILSDGGAVCIFPEGVSHSDVAMRPFARVAAHLAVNYCREHPTGVPLAIIPVGLLYTAKQNFVRMFWSALELRSNPRPGPLTAMASRRPN